MANFKRPTTVDLINNGKYPSAAVNTIIETLGYTAKGDGGGAQWRKTGATGLTASQSPADLVDAKLTDANGHEWELVWDATNTVEQVGAKQNDPGFDNSAAFVSYFAASASEGSTINFNKRTYYFSEPLSVSLTSDRTIKEGTLIYNGSADLQVFVRIRTTANLICKNLLVDGQSLTSKVVLINPNSASCEVYLNNCSGVGGLQTDVATGFAVGFQVSPEAGVGDFFSRCYVQGGRFADVTSTKTHDGELTSVGRGAYIAECQDAQVFGAVFENIGPYFDGDGLVVTADAAAPGRREDFRFISDGCSFIDCQKRAIKSQVAGTAIGLVNVVRTQAFPFEDGQCEVACQEGGSVGRVVGQYADGAAPRGIVNFLISNASTYRLGRCSLGGVELRMADKTDVIEYIVLFALHAADIPVSNCVARNLDVPCSVRNIARLYTANQTVNETKFEDLTLENVNVGGFSGVTEDAVFFLTRGASSYNKSQVRVRNITATDGTVPALYYKDPAPGSVAFLDLDALESDNAPTLNGREVLKTTSSTRTYTYQVAEDAAATVTFDLASFYASVLVTVSYTSSRDALANKLVTQGIIQASSARTYYRELIAGVKTSTQTGTIAVNEDAGNIRFTVTKTAGSTSSTGFLYITVEGADHISAVS